MIKRLMDISMAVVIAPAAALPMLVIALVVRLSSGGPVIYWSKRVGRRNQLFEMPKFRTMRTGTPVVATHLLEQADEVLTPVGRFLRSTSLDELPQLWCVLRGEMSFVGPRPALFNQDDLIQLRTADGVHELRPGITGWAQCNGRDELSVSEKAAYDAEYLRKQSLLLDLCILGRTAVKVLRRQGVAH